MTLIEKKSRAVAAQASRNSVVRFDPATILLIIELVIALVRFVKRWKSAEKALKIAHNPGLVAEAYIALLVRLKFFPEERAGVYEALLKTMSESTLEEVQQAYAEVG